MDRREIFTINEALGIALQGWKKGGGSGQR